MDDFNREIYCIAGLPFDAVDLPKTLTRLRDAQFKKTPCFLTTPNLDFLALAQHDSYFRDSVIQSDLVIADGMPIVWIAKLLGIPIHERVAGSTLFEALGQERRRKMTVYFFGGPQGVAAEASQRINAVSTGLTCVGYYSPGFGTLDEMSSDEIVDNINAANADFLVVALGAEKGQAWIIKNFHKIKCPLVSHLGAVINFEAKRLKRAPESIQKLGMEWAWRIKEEPQLWRRYWGDGLFLLRLIITKILPLVIWKLLNKKRLVQLAQDTVVLDDKYADCKLTITGVVLDPVKPDIRSLMRQASLQNKNVNIDLAAAEYLSFGALGLLLMLKKQLDKNGLQMKVTGLSHHMIKLFNQNGLSYLIE